MTREWSAELETLRERLGRLINRSVGDPSREVAAEALEELAVAIEELQTQNNELLASQADVVFERRRYEELFDTVPDGYLLTTAEGIITEANATACDLFGMSRAKLVGHPLVRYIADADRRAFYSLLHRVGQAAVGEMLTIDLTIKDHELIPASLRASAGPDPADRSVVRWLIHDQRNELDAEELRASEERLRKLFETADVGIVLCDASGDLVFINNQAAELLGISDGSNRGRDWLRHVPTDQRFEIDNKLEAARAGVRSPSIRHQIERVVRDQLVTCWVDHGVVPFQTRAGQPNGFLSTLTDVTLEQTALADQRSSTEFLNAILETAGTIVVVADPAGNIQMFNRMAERVTGWSQSEAIGQSAVKLLVRPEDQQHVAELLVRVTNGEVVTSENDLMTQSGHRRRIAWTTTALISASGAVTGIVATGLDVTEQRQMERRIAQTERLHSMGRLAAGIAHDFNNTLAVILARIDRIDRRSENPETIADVEALRRSIRRSSTMITDLLTLSGRHPQAPATAPLSLELERATAMLTDLVGPDISIELALPPSETWVAIGPDRLDQVLTNLILNARDAMPDGGAITITAAVDHGEASKPSLFDVGLAPGHYVRISVTDTGTGIEPGAIAHVFEPYFTTKVQGKGTGIGLAMVYGIVQQSGGAIIVESETGEGSTFTLWLPSTTEPDSGDAAEDEGIEPPRHREPVPTQRTVLVVEDDEELQGLLVDELEVEGFAVTGIARGDHAIGLLDSHFDLLITDVDLPGADGFEVAARWSERWPRIALLFISGVASEATSQLIPHGAGFLAKPFTRAAMMRSVHHALAGGKPASSMDGVGS